MKNILIGFGIILLSLLVTLITFETMSWYHFGDNPTKVVLIRLIIFFFVMVIMFTGIIKIIKKLRK